MRDDIYFSQFASARILFNYNINIMNFSIIYRQLKKNKSERLPDEEKSGWVHICSYWRREGGDIGIHGRQGFSTLPYFFVYIKVHCKQEKT